jgi:hypothetical protein
MGAVVSAFDPVLIPAVTGTLAGVASLLMLRKERVSAARKQGELQSMLEQQRDEFSQQIAQLNHSIGILELSARSVEEAGRGLTRSRRSQAIQLIRAGMAPESAASSLGIARREMRLIATVSRMLSLQ